MGTKTDIEYCDTTGNPTTGCDGCELWNPTVKTCYAGGLHETRLAKSLPGLYAPNFNEVRMIPGRMEKLAKLPDLRGTERPDKPWLSGFPRIIFVGDMADIMSRDVSTDFILDEVLHWIDSEPGRRHFWMIFTKQITRLRRISDLVHGLPENCMAVTSVTDQNTVNTRVPELMEVWCRYRGLSVAPLLEPINLSRALPRRCHGCQSCGFTGNHGSRGVDWVALEGESGTGCRPLHTDTARAVRDQVTAAGVPFFFKQWGGPNKRFKGRILDEREWNQMPVALDKMALGEGRVR